MANHINDNPNNRTETNFIEILLREMMIGKTIYLEDDTPVIIDDLNYQPLIEAVYITSGNNSYKMQLNRNFDFDYSQVNKIIPNKHKITGKFTR
jgi:hypothetical protein